MKIKEVVFGIAIIVLTIFVTIYGISVFYPAVEYEDYCGNVKTNEIINDAERCVEVGGQWTDYGLSKIDGEPTGYCDREYECRLEYEAADKIRAKKVFYISLPLGIIILVIGGFLFYLESVGAGLMGGGVGTIIYGAGNYWEYGDDLFRFIISLLGLAAVIYLAYWLNKRRKKKKKFFFWKK
jgi:hypothetical protein